jgi:hypothetical protein
MPPFGPGRLQLARFRFQRRKAWRFDPSLAHEIEIVELVERGLRVWLGGLGLRATIGRKLNCRLRL